MCYPSPGPRCSYHAHKEYVEILQKYSLCDNADEKLILGQRLEDKQALYDSTPRGQNELRRLSNSVNGVERETFMLRAKAGENLRAKQLKEYQQVVERQDTSLKEKLFDKGLSVNKYEMATGIALLNLTNNIPDADFHMENDTTLISEKGKVLVVPESFQQKWDVTKFIDNKFTHINQDLRNILNTSFNLQDLTESHKDLAYSWFEVSLKARAYVGVCAVNRKTQDSIFIKTDNIKDVYDISLKLKKRLGGTSPYTGSIPAVENLIKDSVFSEGKVIREPKTGKTIIYDVLPQSKAESFLSDDIYLGWHSLGESDGYYEVRKRHQSNNYDIYVQLKAKKQVDITSVDDSLKEKFLTK